MPTYEYKCDACGHAFEKFQSITAAPVRKCPACGKAKARRLISAGGGMIFKGSGFYITDYRSEGYQTSAKADAPPTTTDAKSDAPKSDAKSDAKPTQAKAPAKAEATPVKTDPKPAAKTDSKPPKSGNKF